ncbi:endonuclease/exonuclease/phosphatase family protein [Lysobacter sp. MMG2]|uniref:endonuclease/exonuclease/phosphatase family protein n=1 Tax=Lysobacter sp. MMG2 TaxID=2801338 RepID=UPI001C241F80|nr:endonuclease/exonuclease/phosphatase family protein [Lysobacter sp. MMG2]MBU8975117.1 endonuclease/exonuclease/phosphatase family protein [Lysobacter sp. MMG2]
MSATSAQCGHTVHRSGFVRQAWKCACTVAMAWMLAACAATTSPRDEAPALDVVTLNLWHDREDWPHRQAMIEAELRRLSPDAILLQEVLQDERLPNQAQALADALGYHAFFVSVDATDPARRYGNAILTREPATLRGFRRLQPDGAYRIAGWVRTNVQGHPVNLYVVHLDFEDRSGATRARQIADLMAFVEVTRGDAPVVIGGDFNTTVGTAEMAPLRARFVDAYAAAHAGVAVEGDAHATLNARFNPPARIDRIHAQQGAFGTAQARRILDTPDADGRWASDHFGIWARLPFAPRLGD